MSCYKMHSLQLIINKIHWLKKKGGNALQNTLFQDFKFRKKKSEDVGIDFNNIQFN